MWSKGFLSHSFFFFNDTAPPEIYTLSLHDALPINDTATTEIYTLSLHDALPISVVAVSFTEKSAVRPGGRGLVGGGSPASWPAGDGRPALLGEDLRDDRVAACGANAVLAALELAEAHLGEVREHRR